MIDKLRLEELGFSEIPDTRTWRYTYNYTSKPLQTFFRVHSRLEGRDSERFDEAYSNSMSYHYPNTDNPHVDGHTSQEVFEKYFSAWKNGEEDLDNKNE